MNIFKKLKLFRSYKKILKETSTKVELENRFNIRLDNAFRMYTVLNIPQDLVGEAYSLRKSDVDRISENFVKEYTGELSRLLNSKGLNELYEIYDMKKVDKYSWLIVVGFSLFKSNKYYNLLYYGIIPAAVILTALSLILFL